MHAKYKVLLLLFTWHSLHISRAMFRTVETFVLKLALRRTGRAVAVPEIASFQPH